MPRIFVSVVCAFWALGFVLRAAGIAELAGGQLANAWSMTALASIACVLVAALFLWVAVSSVFNVEEGASSIAGTAASAAVVTLTLIIPATLDAPIGQLSAELGIHIGALCATWLVVRQCERDFGGARAERPSVDHARQLALRAAHRSMLAQISRRSPDTAGSEV